MKRHTTSADLSARSRNRASLSARFSSATWRSVTSADGKHLGAVGAGQVPIDPLHPLARNVVGSACDSVDQNRVVGTQQGELRVEAGELVFGQKLIQRPAERAGRLNVVLRAAQAALQYVIAGPTDGIDSPAPAALHNNPNAQATSTLYP